MKYSLMLQGTASSVGKTILTLGIGRILAKKGYKIAPFKSQNMSLNSRVIQDRREISWAQYFQAFFIGIEPSFHMNPVLLKPIGNGKSQVIVHGKPWRIVSYKEYYKHHKYLWKKVIESIESLYESYDFLIIEGAGSPAEINLYKYEIANMRVAKYLNSPVFLIGDIERGGVFASLWGTWNLVENKELIKGFIINKFRGDPSILSPGLEKLRSWTKIPVIGVLPYIDFKFPEEDSQIIPFLDRRNRPIKIIKLPYMSNSTDFFPLFSHNMAEYITSIPLNSSKKDTKMIILPGSRNTIHDLLWLKQNGLFSWIKEFAEQGGIIIGICSGYQMLGESIEDPYNIEGNYKAANGFGFFKGKTVIKREKNLKERSVKTISNIDFLGMKSGEIIKGYEIHHGISSFENGKPIFSDDIMLGRVMGNIFGTYLHGLFENKKIIYGINDFFDLNLYRDFALEEEIEKLEDILNENLNWNYIESVLC